MSRAKTSKRNKRKLGENGSHNKGKRKAAQDNEEQEGEQAAKKGLRTSGPGKQGESYVRLPGIGWHWQSNAKVRGGNTNINT